MQLRLMNELRCLVLIMGLVLTHSAVSQENNRDGQYFQRAVNGAYLEGTSTLIISGRPAAAGGKSGEAFFCEGDKEGDYECSNSFATYGCSEACKCCYYEETQE